MANTYRFFNEYGNTPYPLEPALKEVTDDARALFDKLAVLMDETDRVEAEHLFHGVLIGELEMALAAYMLKRSIPAGRGWKTFRK